MAIFKGWHQSCPAIQYRWLIGACECLSPSEPPFEGSDTKRNEGMMLQEEDDVLGIANLWKIVLVTMILQVCKSFFTSSPQNDNRAWFMYKNGLAG